MASDECGRSATYCDRELIVLTKMTESVQINSSSSVSQVPVQIFLPLTVHFICIFSSQTCKWWRKYKHMSVLHWYLTGQALKSPAALITANAGKYSGLST